ncbi:hypothetical protein GALMADRAFT_237553 [Galerina marginata CBS 339.88]|uniref:Uncharacterized protein n=1 Tax=Galerina marginata (strain CBS 339.88) TaxID=685588 RepID=A0A067TQT6_GALM3|nr:hypothetical protein GALMADRAFT_237553 [Galerina marginata CBS 339.88]
MSTQTRNPSSIYIGAVVAIVALSSLGILLRIMAVRRARTAAIMRQNALPGPILYPQRPQSAMPLQGYYTQPRPPANSYTQNRPPNQNTWNPPAPAYSPPYQPPPAPPPASPRFNNNPPPPVFPTPTVPSPPQPPSNRSQPGSQPQTTVADPPPRPEEDGSQLQTNLLDRMREVQTLMLEIHQLESQPGSQTNRTKIQDLQRRVTELSGVDSRPAPPPIVAAVNDNREPPPYNLDGSG